MIDIIYNILIIFFIINGLFWSLATHKQHCDLGKLFNIKMCLSHGIHITIGIISLSIGILIKQRKYFSKLL